jgi:sucrose-6F-phosphate phosphohydrolase
MQLLLCTDLDRTVLPNGPQPESEGARTLLAALAARPDVTLVYVTGRDRQLVKKVITDYYLPLPDYVISDVGTMIYTIDEHDWRLCHDWEKVLESDWAGRGHNDVATLLQDMNALQPQEPGKQNRYKSSYYVPLYVDNDTMSAVISRRLQKNGFRANLIWSVDEPRGVGLLDVLPAAASKEQAIRFLMQQNGFAPGDTVFAGDSGNDLPVLVSDIPAVLVANASADVHREALLEVEKNGNASALYVAQGGFMGMNGNYAAGILEGVVHYKPEIRGWLMEHTGTASANA